MVEEQIQEQEELSEIEIAELANKELKKRDSEIAQLKRELARAKLLSNAEDEEEEGMSKENALEVIFDGNTQFYDYLDATCALYENEIAENKQPSLGKDGEEVYNFFKRVLEECDGDKSRAVSLYQALLPADDKSVAMAYNKRK